MAAPSGKPGRQYTFNVTFRDSDGNPQDLTALEGYALIAHAGPRKVIAQWSKNSVEGFLSIEETSPQDGEVQIVLPADRTQDLVDTMVFIEPVTQFDGELLSSKDGKSFELIKITSSARVKMPDLS